MQQIDQMCRGLWARATPHWEEVMPSALRVETFPTLVWVSTEETQSGQLSHSQECKALRPQRWPVPPEQDLNVEPVVDRILE